MSIDDVIKEKNEYRYWIEAMNDEAEVFKRHAAWALQWPEYIEKQKVMNRDVLFKKFKKITKFDNEGRPIFPSWKKLGLSH